MLILSHLLSQKQAETDNLSESGLINAKVVVDSGVLQIRARLFAAGDELCLLDLTRLTGPQFEFKKIYDEINDLIGQIRTGEEQNQ